MPTPSSAHYQAARQLVIDLGGRPNAVSINLFCAWMAAEFGWPSSVANNNPMASTVVMPGSYRINCLSYVNGVCVSGVQHYPTLAVGVQATVNTLTGPAHYYDTLVQALRTGNAALFFSPKGLQELHTWVKGVNGPPDPAYAASIQNIYNSLPPVPKQYLVGAASAKSTKPMTTVVTVVPTPKGKGPVQQVITYYESLSPGAKIGLDAAVIAGFILLTVGGFYLYQYLQGKSDTIEVEENAN